MNQPIYVLSEEGIKVLAEQITANIKKELPPASNTTPEDEIFDIDSLSSFIRLTKPTIYGHVHRNTIPFFKKGKMLRFSKNDILDWLQSGKNQSKHDLDSKIDTYLSKKSNF